MTSFSSWRRGNSVATQACLACSTSYFSSSYQPVRRDEDEDGFAGNWASEFLVLWFKTFPRKKVNLVDLVDC